MEKENEIKETASTQVQESKGLSIASMVLGIISVVLFCAWYIALPCGILAIIFGIIERKKNKSNKFAKSGFILGIVSIVLSIVVIFIVFFISASLNHGLFERAREAADRAEEARIEEEKLLEELNRTQFNYNYYDTYDF